LKKTHVFTYKHLRTQALSLMILMLLSCGGPIPDDFGLGCVAGYIGRPAEPNPLPPKNVEPHPMLSAVSSIHSDSYNSDVDDFSGPLGINPEVRSSFIGLCPIIMFTDEGRIAAVSLDTEIIGMGITAIDPETLEIIDRYAIPFDFEKLFSGGQGAQGVSVNGGYFHVDKQGRAIVGTQGNLFLELEMQGDSTDQLSWTAIRSIDLNPWLNGESQLIDTQYDWQGNIWFVSSDAVIGYIDGIDASIFSMQLENEFVENGVAVAEDGVFVLTSEAAYRFDIDSDSRQPRHTWRIAYDRGTVIKPGTFALGSGATPTLLGEDLITYTDNADSQVNLLVYHRGEAVAGERLVCQIPLFEPGQSAVDVSVIGYNNSIVVENMYNAGSFFDNYRGLAPGLIRIDVREDRSGCDVVWTADIATTTVPKLSTGTGLIYTYTQLLTVNAPIDAWYLTAVDFETGKEVFKVLTGTGVFKGNAFGGIAIGPDGTVYQGTLGGIIAVRDGQ